MFRQLLSLEDAKRILQQNFQAKPIGKKRVPLLNAYNRILAENVTALINVPSFIKATVDGYAVKAEDTFGAEEDNPVSLRLCGRVNVGEPPKIVVKKGSAAEIVTGAPLPKGADAVVMLEYTTQKDGNTVSIYRSVAKGDNIINVGSDIKKGEVILKKGKTLRSREIGVLAALGLTEIHVYKRPKIAVISTGAELVPQGKPLPEGKIYDINTYTLSVAVLECGGEPVNLGIVPDDEKKLESALKLALSSADVVLTSGGVSVGPKDVVPNVLNRLGKPGVIVCGIATKPGKPTTIALVNGKPIFSLPGHPTSALFMFHMLVRPVIRSMTGKQEKRLFKAVKAVAATRMFTAKGRRTFVMVNLRRDKQGRFFAHPVPTGLSSAITTLAKAEGFVEIAEDRQFVDAGEEVTVKLFEVI